MDTSSSDSTISTYNTNVGDCSCNTHQSTCDIFCCCDTACSDVNFLKYERPKDQLGMPIINVWAVANW